LFLLSTPPIIRVLKVRLRARGRLPYHVHYGINIGNTTGGRASVRQYKMQQLISIPEDVNIPEAGESVRYGKSVRIRRGNRGGILPVG
jgi:hypothetical protein